MAEKEIGLFGPLFNSFYIIFWTEELQRCTFSPELLLQV